jgi:hypothetical protein
MKRKNDLDDLEISLNVQVLIVGVNLGSQNTLINQQEADFLKI